MNDFHWNITVRWADLDPNGHVRHSVYYDYGAQARIAFLQQQGMGITWLAQRGLGPVLFREEARFQRELLFGDELIIDLQLSGISLDHRKWSLRHQILRNSKICATINLEGAWLSLLKRRIVRPPQKLIDTFELIERSEDFQIIT